MINKYLALMVSAVAIFATSANAGHHGHKSAVVPTITQEASYRLRESLGCCNA